MNRGLLSIVVAALMQLACADALHAADSALTYQGELSHDGELAGGAFDMDFSLWDALNGGNQKYIDPDSIGERPGERIGMIAQEVETVLENDALRARLDALERILEQR